MPSNSAGGSKLERKVYGGGSGGLNLGGFVGDDEPLCGLKLARWELFKNNNRNVLSQGNMWLEFCKCFGYVD